jgi:hypothetical protein
MLEFALQSLISRRSRWLYPHGRISGVYLLATCYTHVYLIGMTLLEMATPIGDDNGFGLPSRSLQDERFLTELAAR